MQEIISDVIVPGHHNQNPALDAGSRPPHWIGQTASRHHIGGSFFAPVNTGDFESIFARYPTLIFP
jgi:hypothetical protein